MYTVNIYFDGGANPNPGKAYGSYEIASTLLNHRAIRQQFGEPFTNNQAEYLAFIAALKWLSHHANSQETQLQIFSDSELLVKQIRGHYRVKVAHLRELWTEAKTLLGVYHSFKIQWHGRHNNVKRFGH